MWSTLNTGSAISIRAKDDDDDSLSLFFSLPLIFALVFVPPEHGCKHLCSIFRGEWVHILSYEVSEEEFKAGFSTEVTSR